MRHDGPGSPGLATSELLGHGGSDQPDADYSLGGYATGMRDLLTAPGVDWATMIGQSFGGGVAMQFAYRFPSGPSASSLPPPIGRAGGPPLIRMLTAPGVGHLAGVAA